MSYDPYVPNSKLGMPSTVGGIPLGTPSQMGPTSGLGGTTVNGTGGRTTLAKPVIGPADAGSGPRPGVLSLNIRERTALYAAYMPFLRGGGIFIPTNRPYRLGDEVFMLLTLMDDPAKIAVQGKVVWITPEGVQGNRTQGIGVQFTSDETGAAARNKIETILGGTLSAARATHTL